MQTLTFVPSLAPATLTPPSAAPPPAPPVNGESLKFGCKATGNPVYSLPDLSRGFARISPSPSSLYAAREDRDDEKIVLLFAATGVCIKRAREEGGGCREVR